MVVSVVLFNSIWSKSKWMFSPGLHLSPIETKWDEMKCQLAGGLPYASATLVELQTHLTRIWNNIPQQFHANLTASMRRRCTAVVDADGGIPDIECVTFLFDP